jgi:hypothetical protein
VAADGVAVKHLGLDLRQRARRPFVRLVTLTISNATLPKIAALQGSVERTVVNAYVALVDDGADPLSYE